MASPWMKFYPTDWRADPALRMCSVGARGLWIEMLCVMHEAEPRGSLLVNGKPVSDRQLAGLCGCSPDEIAALLTELEDAGVFSREGGVIFSRRMRRDDEKAAKDKSNGLEGGNPHIRRGIVPKDQRVRPFKRSDAPEKTRRIFERSGGKCHWCSSALLFSGVGGEPNLFHVDHVLPVCDGGTNDEGNLVAACADCNHKRARISDPTGTPVSVGFNSDHKAQKPEARSQSPDIDASASIARAPAVESQKTKLKRRITDAYFRLANDPGRPSIDTGQIDVWEAQGYDLAIVEAVVIERLEARLRSGKPVRSLSYFADTVKEAHEKRASPAPPRAEDLDWRAMMARFKGKGMWPSSAGPQPGYAGCRAPPDLLREFGYGAAA